MARRKWYVVIVGKDIGVFPNWVEAGPLVKGVPEAVHQSFPSEEEARSVFTLAFSKGHARIVGGRRNANQHTSKIPTFSSGSTSLNSYSNRSFPTTSSTPSAKTLSAFLSPRQYRPQTNSAHESPNSKKSFKPDNNKKPTEPVPVETGVFQEDTQVSSTPQSNPSPSLKRPSRRPRAIVKTPSWLASYPKSPQPLSPLDGINFKPSPLTNSGSPSMYRRTPRMSTISPQSNGSDPRSPISCHTKVPASGSNYTSFARPSPSPRRDQLPARHHDPSSSLLFHPTQSAVQMDAH